MKTLLMIVTSALLFTTCAVAAAEPAQNISVAKHGNLAAAQGFTRQAFDKMTVAQSANEYDLGGHAARAKQLLSQAAVEMKLAAIAANHK
jgi:predicted lipoprotein with Yx(FWY)xxD motif